MYFRADVDDATTELQGSVNMRSNTTVFNNTHYNILLAQPAFINSSATQSQGATIFPQK